jgi:hypothetical protein
MNEHSHIILLSLLVISHIVCLILGYILGQLRSISGVSISSQPNKVLQSIVNKDTKQSISIESSKFVTSITTEGMEKKYATLGEIKDSDENISSSVNKLKNMKK